MSHQKILLRDHCALLVIDVQEKLFPLICNRAEVEKNAALLLRAADLLSVPVLITEQYVKGLGPTIDSLLSVTSRRPEVDKVSFSCCGDESFLTRLRSLDRRQIVICGIETHVCVLQTALDLTALGYQCHVAADATGSRSPDNRAVALDRLRHEGAVVTCTESVLFEWMRVSGTDEFRAVSKLLR